MKRPYVPTPRTPTRTLNFEVTCGERGFNLLPGGRPGLDFALAAQAPFLVGEIPDEAPFVPPPVLDLIPTPEP